MSVALKFNGINNYVQTPSGGSAVTALMPTDEWMIEFKIKRVIDRDAQYILASSYYGIRVYIRDTQGSLTIATNRAIHTSLVVPNDGEFHIVRVVLSNSSDTVKCYLNDMVTPVDILSGKDANFPVHSDGTGSLHRITLGRYQHTSGGWFEGEIEYAHLKDLAGDAEFYFSADASDHSNTGAQPVFVDTIGNNNATGVNFPADGSAWVDLGGGQVPIEISGNLSPSNPIFLGALEASKPLPIISGDFVTNTPHFSGQILSTKPSPLLEGSIFIDPPVFSGSIISTLPEPKVDGDILVSSPIFNGEVLTTLPHPLLSGSITILSELFRGNISATTYSPQMDGDVSIEPLRFKGEVHSTTPNPNISGLFEINKEGIFGSISASKPSIDILGNLQEKGVSFSGSIDTTTPFPKGIIQFKETSIAFSGDVITTLPQPLFSGNFSLYTPDFMGQAFISGNFIQSTTNIVWIDVPNNSIIIEDVENLVIID